MTNFVSEKIINQAPDKFTVLSTPIERAPQTSVDVIKSFVDLGYRGIIISLVKDYRETVNLLFQNKVDISKLFFVDGISRLYGIAESTDKNVIYIPGPLSLDEITDILSKQLKSSSEKKFIYIDSVTSILLYNSIERTSEFIININKLVNGICPVIGSLYDEGNVKLAITSGLDGNVNMVDYVSS